MLCERVRTRENIRSELDGFIEVGTFKIYSDTADGLMGDCRTKSGRLSAIAKFPCAKLLQLNAKAL